MPGGRPTIYTPEFGERIITLMSEGLSLTAAAAEMNVHRQQVYDWKEKFPEFNYAVNIAMAKRQLFLERRLYNEELGPRVTATIFALKNAGAADWREKQEIEHTGTITHVTAMTDEELERVASAGKKIEGDG